MSAIIVDNILACHCESLPAKAWQAGRFIGTWQSSQALCDEVVK